MELLGFSTKNGIDPPLEQTYLLLTVLPIILLPGWREDFGMKLYSMDLRERVVAA
ncbi:MAG: hypothetical protein AABZ47_16235 [Planctomycetota bacterium]